MKGGNVAWPVFLGLSYNQSDLTMISAHPNGRGKYNVKRQMTVCFDQKYNALYGTAVIGMNIAFKLTAL